MALGALAVAPVSAEAADMTLKGRFTCNDGQPLAETRVELMHTKTRLLPEIWPNQTVAGAGRTGPNGEWEWRVRGGETNWRVRAVLVNNDVGVKNFPTTWHHYHDTLRTQNNRPLADYGTQVVPGAECRLWAAFKSAADGYRADTGTSNPAGKVLVLDNAPTSGVPFTPYTDVFWPGNYAPIRNIGTAAAPVMRSVAQHEFAHSFRHQLDGDKAHFTFDSARFWYLRSHSSTSCASTNHGFAFNEGWAEYWADEVPATPCTNSQDFSIERNVGFELKRLQSACAGVTRGRMVQVLAENRGRIHSMSDFSNALRCQPPPRPIRSTGKARPASAVSALAAARLLAGRDFLSDITRLITGARSRLARTNGFAERELLRARIDQARALRSTFAYLGSRAEQARIARLSDRQQVDLLATRQREYMRQVRSITSAALRAIAERLGRAGNRQGAQVLNRAGAGAAAGRLDVLQAAGQPLDVTPAPGGPDTQTPTPGVPPAGAPGGVPGIPPPISTPTVPKPDLVVPLVVSLVYRDDPLGCTVNYRRGNEGTVAAGPSTTSVQLASPGQVTLTSTIAAVPLAPGQLQQESIVFPGINCDVDLYTVTATVTADSTNAVDESSETNNSGSRTFGPG
jgi:CARDB